MNCKVLQYRMLSLERLDQPPPELADHVGVCAPCRDWLHQLHQLERHVPLLAVPPAEGKARLLQRVLADHEEPRAASRKRAEPSWKIRERQLKRLAVISSMVAALVLVAVGLLLWKQSGGQPVVKRPPADDPLMASLVRHNLTLASATTGRQSLDALADVADDLHRETVSQCEVADGDDLTELAQLYRYVVIDGIVKRASALPAGDRPAALDRIAGRLERVERDADQMADRDPSGAVRPLREIAAAAREGKERLVVLRGGKS